MRLGKIRGWMVVVTSTCLLLLIQSFPTRCCWCLHQTITTRIWQKSDGHLVPSLKEFMVERTVTVNPVARGLLPLQVYRGRLPARAIPAKDSPHDEEECFQNSQDLSVSSRALVEQYDDLTRADQRNLSKKLQAEAKAAKPVNAAQHLHILYVDEHLCVTCKPSGILSVPGPRRNPSLANLVHQHVVLGGSLEHGSREEVLDIDKMVVHRLDMDTSGILVFALTEQALKRLHADFRQRRVKKVYQALVAGHVVPMEVQIDVNLERDPDHPPFMRVAQPRDHTTAITGGGAKFLHEAPKPSRTDLHVLGRFDWNAGAVTALPVTRVQLVPHTGRTHQLRVHTAALGFPILGDSIYGHGGEAPAVECDTTSCSNHDYLAAAYQKVGMPLCLHAETLSLYHPYTGAPMMFSCKAPF